MRVEVTDLKDKTDESGEEVCSKDKVKHSIAKCAICTCLIFNFELVNGKVVSSWPFY